MNDSNQTSSPTTSKKLSFKIILFAGLILVLMCMGILVTGYIFISRSPYDFYLEGEGFYDIDQVILTDKLDKDGHPIGSKTKFRPSDPIISWVSTKGANGIIGMRWFYGDQMIFEHFGKTQDNQIYTYIQSNKMVKLEEGDYRVEIHTTRGTPYKTLHFTIEQYRPEVVPAQPTPIGHQRIEAPPDHVEVPFAFDEVWKIEGTEWPINEVKIVFLEDGSVFVLVTVQVQMDPGQLSDDEARELAKPIALYAVQNEYLEKGRSLEIDGISYPLDEVIFVNLAHRIDKTSTMNNRILFKLDELLDQ